MRGIKIAGGKPGIFRIYFIRIDLFHELGIHIDFALLQKCILDQPFLCFKIIANGITHRFHGSLCKLWFTQGVTSSIGGAKCFDFLLLLVQLNGSCTQFEILIIRFCLPIQ